MTPQKIKYAIGRVIRVRPKKAAIVPFQTSTITYFSGLATSRNTSIE